MPVELGFDTLHRNIKILLVNLHADEFSAGADAGDGRCAAAHEWVEDGLAFHEREAPLHKGDWLLCWMYIPYA